MRILAAAPFAFFAVLAAFACGDSESSSAPSTPGPSDASTADRPTPGTNDSGNGGVPDAAPADSAAADAADAAESGTTCPIAADATVAANIEISVDDNFKLYVNGTLVHEFLGTWNNVQNVAVMLNRNPTKKNVIGLEAVNAMEISGLDRMAVAEVTYTVASTQHKLVTDATWTRGTTFTAGWEAPSFAESGWAPATVQGDHGIAPYGAILGTSDAKLIWSYDSATTDNATKPDTETVYFRKTFYVSQAGAPQATPGTCQ